MNSPAVSCMAGGTNDGLHQAIEAKEKVTVARESKTLATITFQNYFRLYRKLSGMTGTALTEEEEFNATYHLDIVEVPTNKPVHRVDHPDEVYKTPPANTTPSSGRSPPAMKRDSPSWPAPPPLKSRRSSRSC